MEEQYWVSSAITHTGAVRELNEDSFVEIPEHGIWVVADGMGGHEAGEVASKIIVDDIKNSNFSEQQDTSYNHQDKIALLRKSILNSNLKIRDISRQQYNGRTIGSTVIAISLSTTHYNIIWAGDSRTYLFRDGHMQQITRDHSQVEELLANKLITPEEAENHPLANIITRAVGADEELLLDETSGTIQPGDIFLLCSDGLYNEISFADIEGLIKSSTISETNKAFIRSALVHGAKDNITSILIKIKKTDD